MSPRDRVLLVEGRDDREVIYQFCNHYQIDNKNLFSVEAKGVHFIFVCLYLAGHGNAVSLRSSCL
jgi:hypothetical protein